tara:strand:- start:866 stop:1345 length:480 start_codon:yes stop_codon:yes gene_type:complete
MIFESIVAITSAVSAISGLFEQVENGTKNVQTLLGQLGAISSGIDKYEIERRNSLTSPLDGESAMRLAAQKARLDRYHENLRLLSSANSEAARVIDAYFEELEAQKQRHRESVKQAIERQRRRKQMLKDIAQYGILIILATAVAVVTVTLIVKLFGKGF